MKKLGLALASFFMTFAISNAQSITPRVEVDATMGKIDQKVATIDINSKMGFGLRATAGVEYNLAKGIYLYSGLNYNLSNSTIEKAKTSVKETLHYLSIPVNLGARVGLGNIGISGEFGPYFSYGVAANMGGDLSIFGSKEFKTEGFDPFKEFAFGKSLYKRFDMGVGASVALEYSKLYLRVGTEYGLYNFSGFENAEAKRFNVYTGIGLRF